MQRSTIYSAIVLLGVMFLVLFSSASATHAMAAEIFSDDFESYEAGTFPSSGGWAIVYSGAGAAQQYVSTAQAVSGTKSFHTAGSQCWASSLSKALTIPDQVRLEAKVFVEQLVTGGCTILQAQVGLWRSDDSMWAGSVIFGNDGTIYASRGSSVDTLVALTTYSPGQWYEVKIDYDYLLKTFDVYINGVLKGNAITILDDLTNKMPDAVRVGAVHGNTPGNPVAWYDDVKVSEMTCVSPSSGLVSWWPGDDAAEDIVGLHEGTLMNGAAYSPGKVRQAFSFDGLDDFVEIQNDTSLNPSQLTVDAWFYANNVTTYAPAIVKSDAYGLELYTNEVSFWVVFGDNEWVESPVAIVSEGTWYHVAGTYDGQYIKLYLNGVPQGSPTFKEGTVKSATLPLNIGRDPDSTHENYANRYFNGRIDEVTIYDRALSSEEIAAIYNSGSAGKCRSCELTVSWWRAEQDGDDSAGTNNGTLIGGATFAAGKVGKAFSFDGVDDYVQVLSPEGLPVGNSPRSMDVWFKTPRDLTTSTESAIVEYGTVAASQMFGLITSANAPGKLYFYGHGNDLAGTTTIAPDTWYHGAVTFDGSNLSLYLNGQLENSAPTALNTVLSGDLTIGYRSESSLWQGLIDEVTIYDRALSAEEIAAIYNAGSMGKCAPETVDWSSIPGLTSSAPATAWNTAESMLQMVVRAYDSSLWTSTFSSSGTFNNDWARIPGLTSNTPALVWNPVASKLFMVVRASDDTLWMASFSSMGTFNDDWGTFPGVAANEPALAWNPVASQVQMLIRASDGTLWKATFDANGAFNNDWANVPGISANVPVLAWNPVANEMQLVVRASDGTLWGSTFSSNGDFNNDWVNIPGVLADAPALVWDEYDSKFYLAGRASDSSMWLSSLASDGTFNDDWANFPGLADSSPSMAYLPSTYDLNLLVRAADNSLWTILFTP